MAEDTRPLDDEPGPFTHGVASFDPTADALLLWTRVAGHAGPVRWCVAPATDVAPSAEGTVEVPSDADGCVSVPVGGLLPATTYRYWFEAGGHRSPVGRARTLPATGTDRFRIAVVCCGDYAQGYFGAYRAVADAQVDLVLHLGDYIYEAEARGAGARPAEPDHTLVSLDDYRARYAQTRADPDLLALHQRHPVVAIWDDHDIADNAWRHGAKAHDEAEHGPWEDRLAAATRAWHEWLPTRRPEGHGPYAIWRSLAIGDLAELVLLDTRVDGRDQHADDDPARRVDDPDRAMLGDAQRAWAHERIRDTSRPWCLLATAVVLNRMQLPVPVGSVVSDRLPSGYDIIDGAALCTDEWDGYPAERDRLVAAIADRGAGVVALSGDVHSAWAFEGPRDGDGNPVAVEFTATCVTSTPMGAQLPRGWRKLAGGLAERLPEARWFELERHGFTVLDIDAERVRADWFSIDITDPDATPEPAAAWAVRLDRPGHLEEVGAVPERPAAPAGSSAARADADAVVRVPGRPDDVGPRRRAPARWLAPAALAVAAGLWLRRRR